MSLRSPKQWRDSASYAFAIVAAIGIIQSVVGITLVDVFPQLPWWQLLAASLLAFLVILAAVYVVLMKMAAKGVSLRIHGIPVTIKQGDLFTAQGWKIISCTDHFDTDVNDVRIAATSVNGVFITDHVNDDLEALKKVIAEDAAKQKPQSRIRDRTTFPLGHCIAFKGEYILLSFAHLSERNVAHLSMAEYVTCLMTMWQEVRRLYANKPVCLPLLGSGILSLDNITEKSNEDLLKIMLYTLKMSGEHINQPVTILLTQEVMQGINLYEVKASL